MATTDGEPPVPGVSDVTLPKLPEAGPPRWYARVDGAIYGIEQAIVIGSLLVMTLTYVLTVLRNNAVREVNTVDLLLLGVAGYADQEEAPQSVVDAVTTLWTPLLLGVLVFGMVLLAIRTRSRVGLAPGASPPPVRWGPRLLLAAVITGGLVVLVLVLKAVPLTWVCVIALVVLMGATVVIAVRAQERVPVARLVPAVLGGLAVVVYFVSTANWTHAGVGAVLMIYLGFFGASMATREGKHITVDAIRKSLKSRYYHLYNAVSWTVTALFTGFLLMMALLTLLRNLSADNMHQSSQLPLYMVIAPIVIAFALMVIRFLAHAAQALVAFRRGEPAPAAVVELHLMLGARILGAAAEVAEAAGESVASDSGGGWIWLVVTIVGLIALGAPLYVIIGAFIFVCYAVYPEYADPFGDNFVNNFDGTGSMIGLVDTPELVAIPFFMIAGVIMGRGAIAQRLVDFASALFAWMPGGLAVSTIFACAFFAAISGSSPVTVVTIGAVMIPAMKAAGYSDKMSYGLVTSAGGLGIIIPPSIPMVVYAIYASVEGKKVRVDDIFLAGIIPGIIIALILTAYCMIACRNMGGRIPFSFRRVYRAFMDGIWALFLPVFILGGIYLSLFSAVEAAAMSVILAIVIEVWIHRSMKLKDIPPVLSEMSILMGAILIIITIAMRFTQFVEDRQITEDIGVWLQGMDLSPFMFLLILNGLLLIVGCLLDIISAIVLFVPLLVPIALQCGIDPLHLGLIFIVNLEIGYLTPPLGLNLFVASTYFEKPFGMIVKAVAPFLLLMLVSLTIITYVPTASLAVSQLQKGESIWVSFPDNVKCDVEQAIDADSMKSIMDTDDEVNELFDSYLDEEGSEGDDFDGGGDEGTDEEAPDPLDLEGATDDFDAEPVKPEAEPPGDGTQDPLLEDMPDELDAE